MKQEKLAFGNKIDVGGRRQESDKRPALGKKERREGRERKYGSSVKKERLGPGRGRGRGAVLPMPMIGRGSHVGPRNGSTC